MGHKHDQGIEAPVMEEQAERLASRRGVSRGILSMHVNKYRRWHRTLSGIQWKEKRQWVQTEIQEISFKIKKNLFPCKGSQTQQEGAPRG